MNSAVTRQNMKTNHQTLDIVTVDSQEGVSGFRHPGNWVKPVEKPGRKPAPQLIQL